MVIMQNFFKEVEVKGFFGLINGLGIFIDFLGYFEIKVVYCYYDEVIDLFFRV